MIKFFIILNWLILRSFLYVYVLLEHFSEVASSFSFFLFIVHKFIFIIGQIGKSLLFLIHLFGQESFLFFWDWLFTLSLHVDKFSLFLRLLIIQIFFFFLILSLLKVLNQTPESFVFWSDVGWGFAHVEFTWWIKSTSKNTTKSWILHIIL